MYLFCVLYFSGCIGKSVMHMAKSSSHAVKSLKD